MTRIESAGPVTSRGARLSLRGHPPVEATLGIEQRTRKTRLLESGVAILFFWGIAPLVALVPPHLPWALGALSAGVFFAYRRWTGEYVVHSFTGTCPRCHSPLPLPPGTRIRFPHGMDCFQCHHKPVLELRG